MTGIDLSQRRRIWLLISTVWLESIVVAFVAVQVNRISTPVADWLYKVIDLVTAR